MEIDGKAILERLRNEPKELKKKFTHTLTPSVYAEFQRRCGDVPASEVLEELLKAFIATTPEPGPKGKK